MQGQSVRCPTPTATFSLVPGLYIQALIIFESSALE